MDPAQLDSFRVARFSLTLEARDRLRLPPYKGSALRGGFGHVFRKVACTVRGGECPPCLLKSACPYAYIFETPPPSDSAILRKYPHAPHPFVIEPPDDATTMYEPGAQLTFGLVLVGKAIDYLPYFIYAFEELGRLGIGRDRGAFRLAEARGEAASGEGDTWRPIYSGDSKILTNGFLIRTARDLFHNHEHAHDPVHDPVGAPVHEHVHDHEVVLHLLTPMRLRFDEALVNHLDFHVLIRNLLRRLSALSYFHCGRQLNLDFKEFIASAQEVKAEETDLRWVDWTRYSNRQKRKIQMGGLIGQVTYSGPLAEFLPFLRLGELVHVGKGTVFGLGKYTLRTE
ncbi:hypothetical protein MELA_00766 [Candidatus Methylomirabilis lanthanidiphila]|uniref:CRISPR-associated protein Cas6 C-terminal domain-containing protein n=1 Tax=Candidatus Methylomirabilis lanthanidiphila TaxID=2211376 RepID=A0A564ZGG7_9BACT|nr:CRISPR system precrRNA processing endoribonuclease RAMP protein Cas6 [Candidatus Methylomirabilis lanthanidiphila]VUZ84395.1 hypothetical protein MELA_00766 [Candidatus Methylomirabilis lanthanidiphila]